VLSRSCERNNAAQKPLHPYMWCFAVSGARSALAEWHFTVRLQRFADAITISLKLAAKTFEERAWFSGVNLQRIFITPLSRQQLIVKISRGQVSGGLLLNCWVKISGPQTKHSSEAPCRTR
jgi:hypothetical protein